VCLCSLFTLFLSSSISIKHMGHTAVVLVLHLSGLKRILRRPGPCSGRQLHYSLPCVPGTPKVRNPHIELISPHSAPRAPTPTHYHTNTVYTPLIGVCYYTVTIQKLSRAFFTPLKGESNSPRVSQVWIARRHNVASRHPMDMVDRHMRCVSFINWFTLYCIGRAKSQERRTRNRKDQRQKSKSYLAYQQGKIRTKRVSGTIKHFKLREQLGTVIYPCRRI